MELKHRILKKISNLEKRIDGKTTLDETHTEAMRRGLKALRKLTGKEDSPYNVKQKRKTGIVLEALKHLSPGEFLYTDIPAYIVTRYIQYMKLKASVKTVKVLEATKKEHIQVMLTKVTLTKR